METARHITSVARLLDARDQELTECYVVAIGFSGLTAISERPVPPGTRVTLELVYVTSSGSLAGETLKGRITNSTPRTGSHLLQLSFDRPLADNASELARLIRRETGEPPPEPPPRSHEAAAGNA